MALISIIVPIYNVEKYLPRCINSILAQSFRNFELLLIDDGSTDHCGLICDSFEKKDNRIIAIHLENAGPSAARNAGIEKAKGEWIAFVDADDWIHKDYLKVLVNGVLEDTDVIACDCYITSSEVEDSIISDVDYRDITVKERRNNHLINTRIWGRLYRKRRIGNLRFIAGMDMHEDSCFNELFFDDNTRVRTTNEKLYYYYQRPDSAMHHEMGRKSLKAIDLLLSKIDEIRDKDKRKRVITRCYRYVFAVRFGEMFTNNYSKILKQCNIYFKALSVYNKELDLKERAVYSILSRFPFIYRIWRIHDDPTLKVFEKEKKRKRKAESE